MLGNRFLSISNKMKNSRGLVGKLASPRFLVQLQSANEYNNPFIPSFFGIKIWEYKKIIVFLPYETKRTGL